MNELITGFEEAANFETNKYARIVPKKQQLVAMTEFAE
jgi:hypothetical protein